MNSPDPNLYYLTEFIKRHTSVQSALLGFDNPSQGKKKRSEGFIGLQCHTEVVQFRNIRIKEL